MDNVNVTPVNREFLSSQGILKGMGSKTKNMQDKLKKRVIKQLGKAAKEVVRISGKTPSNLLNKESVNKTVKEYSSIAKEVSRISGKVPASVAKKSDASKTMKQYNSAFDINKIQAEDIKKQGGKTPANVVKQIQSKRAYDVKYGPGLYKSKKK